MSALLQTLVGFILNPVLKWIGGLLSKIVTALIEKWKAKNRVKDADKVADQKATEHVEEMKKAETDDEFDKAARDSFN